MASGRPASLSGEAQPVGGRRIVFLGTSEFAAGVLEALAASPHLPVLTLTRPDRPAGRGRRLSSPPVADTARTLKIPLEQPDGVNDPAVRELIAAVKPDAVVVCAFGALIKEPLLSDFEILNLHPSLLPRWRGAAPIERAIMAGDAETGVSIMRLTAGLDSGPVCLTATEQIAPADTYGSLAPRLRLLGGELLVQALSEHPRFKEQNEAGVTYAEKISPEDRLLDPARPALVLERVVRALHPHIGARVAREDGSLIGVQRASLWEGELAEQAEGELAGQEGELAGQGEGADLGLVVREGRLLLRCGSGALELLEVQPPGGKPMDAAAFLRGHGLSQG